MSSDLVAVAGEINREHEAARAAAVTAVEHARRAGERLLEVKAQLGHGEWLPWVREHLAFSERTAQTYMRVASRLPGLAESNAQRVADLPLREAMAELADPHPSTESLDWIGRTEGMSLREFLVYCQRLRDTTEALWAEFNALGTRARESGDIRELLHLRDVVSYELQAKLGQLDGEWRRIEPTITVCKEECEDRILELKGYRLYKHPPADWGNWRPSSRRECLRKVRELPESVLNDEAEIDWMPLDRARREIGDILWSHHDLHTGATA